MEQTAKRLSKFSKLCLLVFPDHQNDVTAAKFALQLKQTVSLLINLRD